MKKLLCTLLVLASSVGVDAGEWQRYRGPAYHWFVPTSQPKAYYGYIDPNPPRVPLGAMFDQSRTQRGRQYIIDTPSVTYPNGVVRYYPYQLY